MKVKIEIGQKVFIIERNLEIKEKEVLAIINTEDKIGYTLDKHSCGGYNEGDVFVTKSKAEAIKQDFLDELKFKVGDLLIFKVKSGWEKGNRVVGRVHEIRFNENEPYNIKTTNSETFDLADDEDVLKINNSFIENFGNMRELYEEFNEKKKELDEVYREISTEHEYLERELGNSFRKQFPWYSRSKKPLFKDRFCYQKEEDY